MIETSPTWFAERRRLWVSGAVALVLGLAALALYQGMFAGRMEVLGARIARLEGELGGLEARRQHLDGMHAIARQREADIAELYDVRLGTEEQRFTRFITEVKQLARDAGLDPTTLSYPSELLEDYGLVQRAAVFTVTGTYEGLRQFLNFLELSDSFLIVQQLALVEQAGNQLSIQVRVATLFADPEAPRRRAGAAPRPRSAPSTVSSEEERRAEASEL
jgi:Tfp pilus assembly protein PilN